MNIGPLPDRRPPLIEISVQDYYSNANSRALADLVVELAGIDKNHCEHIELRDGVWRFKMHDLDDNGRIRTLGNSIVYRTETWAA